MKPSDSGPGGIAWCVATVSLVLPWIGLAFCAVGAARIYDGSHGGWMLVAAGSVLVVLDVVIDFVWAHPSITPSDQPDLNRRGAHYIGRVCVLAEPIAAGRGRVRIGDTLWTVEGGDAPAGTQVKVTAVHGTVLVVVPE